MWSRVRPPSNKEAIVGQLADISTARGNNGDEGEGESLLIAISLYSTPSYGGKYFLWHKEHCCQAKRNFASKVWIIKSKRIQYF
jgi:hypothetical protein